MTEQENIELAELSEAKSRAEEALYNFGFTNVSGVHGNDLVALNLRRAQLEAAAIEASARYRAFMGRLAQKAGS